MDGEDVLALNQQDRDRLKELHAVIKGRQKVGEAAKHLGLKSDGTGRLVRRVERRETKGTAPPARPAIESCNPEELRSRAAALLTQERYLDFAPTLATEHLERIGIRVSRETVRGLANPGGPVEDAAAEDRGRARLARDEPPSANSS